MNKNEKRQSTILEMLFTYLAISKILYWFNTFYALLQYDLGTAAEAFLIRFLNQDFMIIVGVLIFFKLDTLIEKRKSKENALLATILFYIIGYALLMGASIAYTLIITAFTGESLNWNEFYYFLRLSIIWYLMIIVVLSIKDYLKNRQKKLSECDPEKYSAEEKLSMLEVLLRDGVLTQEEFDIKKERVLGV